MAPLHRERHRAAHATNLRRRVVALVALAVVALVVLFATRADGVATRGAQLVHFTIQSRIGHAAMPVTAVIPPGSTGQVRPLLVFLHGKGGDQNSSISDQLFAALAGLGARAPDVVFPYGGPDSYWHDRADGAWGSYVYDEVIPQAIRRLHADPARLAIGGVSMGGFGALDLARLHPGRFCAVGGHSAALWVSGGQSAPGAFDNAEDERRDDGELRADGQAVQFHSWAGAHEIAYWDSHWGDYLSFYAGALAGCHRG